MILAFLPCTLATELGARALGRGGVGFADGTDPSAEQWNLAALSLIPRYTFYGGAELGPSARFLLRGGAIDSRTAAFAVGAGYRRIWDNEAPTLGELPGWKVPGEEISNEGIHQGAHVGVAVPFLDRRLSVAAHARFDWRTTELDGEDDAFNFGFSVAGSPIEQLGLSLGAFNLLDTDYARVTRYGLVGVRYVPIQVLGVEVDAGIPLDATLGVTTLDVGLGVDVEPIDWLRVRAGGAVESEHPFAAVGIAFVSPVASIDYGVRLRLDSLDRSWHALDVRVEF